MASYDGALLQSPSALPFEMHAEEIRMQYENVVIENKNTVSVKEILADKAVVSIQKSFIQPYVLLKTDTIKTDSIKIEEPKLQPLIPSGAGVYAAGLALTTLSILSGGISILFGIAAIIAGLLLVNWGYKKVKTEPKKWKGEKLALIVYYTLIPVGLFLMLYPVYLLFLL